MNARDMLLIGIGGAFGAISRAWLSITLQQWLGPRFPWGTLGVNLLGCFVLGYIFKALATPFPNGDIYRMLLATGFLGAFTTFSTFSLETVQRWTDQPTVAVANVAANVGLGLIFVLLGLRLAI